MNKIPTFRGRNRIRDHSLEAILKLEAQGRVMVKRHEQTGAVEAAQFVPKKERPIIPRTYTAPPTGTYYSFEELVEAAGHYAWTHKDLTRDARRIVEKQAVDVFLLQVFRAVPLSCMARPVEDNSIAQVAQRVSVGRKKLLLEADTRRAQKKLKRAHARREKRKAK